MLPNPELVAEISKMHTRPTLLIGSVPMIGPWASHLRLARITGAWAHLLGPGPRPTYWGPGQLGPGPTCLDPGTLGPCAAKTSMDETPKARYGLILSQD